MASLAGSMSPLDLVLGLVAGGALLLSAHLVLAVRRLRRLDRAGEVIVDALVPAKGGAAQFPLSPPAPAPAGPRREGLS